MTQPKRADGFSTPLHTGRSLVLRALTAWAAFAAAGNVGAQSSAGDSAASAQLEEVVITAEKREQDLQKTAVAVTVVSGEELRERGRADIGDAIRMVAGVNVRFGANPTAPIVSVRGLEANSARDAGGDSTVSVNVDGIYQSNNGSSPMFDVARIEVLKGPQGTLYGRNSVAGIVNVITVDPGDVAAGFATAQLGSLGARRFEAAATVPINEELSTRLAFLSNRRNGYLSNGNSGLGDTALRGKLLFKPTEKINVTLSGEYDHTDTTSQGSVPTGLADRRDPWATPDPAGKYQADKRSIYSIVDWDVGFGVLTFEPGFYDYKYAFDTEILGPQQGLSFEGSWSKQWSGELRLAQPASSKLKWQTGLYYLDFTQSIYPDFPLVPAPVRSGAATGQFLPAFTTAQAFAAPGTVFRRPLAATGSAQPYVTGKSWAVFGQTTYPVTDGFRATGGIRYTEDRKGRTTLVYNGRGVETDPYGPIAVTDAGTTPCTPTASACTAASNFSAVTWKAGIEYDLAANTMLYADAANAFKSGGLNGYPLSAGFQGTYGPEKLLAYESGLKTRFFDSRLQINTDVYLYKYTDKQVQVQAPSPVPGGGTTAPIINAGDATIYGVESALEWLATRNDRIRATVAYNHSRLDTILPAASQFSANVGQPLPPSPLWTEQLGYEHTFVLGSAGTLAAGADIVYRSSFRTNIDFTRVDSLQPGYHQSEARLSYNSQGGRWNVTAYGSNLENVAVRAASFSGATTIGTVTYPGRLLLQPPRLYGISLTLKW